MDGLTGGKVLSIGVVAKEYKSQSPNKEKIAQKASRERYRNQLEQDMAIRAEAIEREQHSYDLHPFEQPGSTRLRDKHNENVHGETYEGYQVGSQSDKTEAARRRRDAQQKYLNQLERDVQTKKDVEASPPAKKVVPRRPVSPQVHGEFAIGVKSTNDGEQKKDKAREFYQMNQSEIERRQMMKTQKNKEVDIDGRFCIGGDDDKKKEKKAAANRQYMEALNKDLGDRTSTRKVSSEQEYVNRSGWSGLNIGGDSGAASIQLKQKTKQQAYRDALDTQMCEAAERQRAVKLKDEESLANVGNLPYLESERY